MMTKPRASTQLKVSCTLQRKPPHGRRNTAQTITMRTCSNAVQHSTVQYSTVQHLVQHGFGGGGQLLGHTHSCVVPEGMRHDVDKGPDEQPALSPSKYHLKSINCILHPPLWAQRHSSQNSTFGYRDEIHWPHCNKQSQHTKHAYKANIS